MSVTLSQRDEAAVLTLDRPQALNALSFAILDELDAAFDEVASSDARVLLITGAGDKAFCAGADIKELRNRDTLSQKRGAEKGQAVFSRLTALPMPSVAHSSLACKTGRVPGTHRASRTSGPECDSAKMKKSNSQHPFSTSRATATARSAS